MYLALILGAFLLFNLINPATPPGKTSYSDIKTKIRGFAVGLGGRDVTKKLIKEIIRETVKDKDVSVFKG